MAKAPGSHGNSDDFRQRIEQQMQRPKGDQAPAAPSANANDTDQAAATQDEQEPYVDSSAGPVGAGERVVKKGDCISSIAVETGHFWKKLWNDPGNSELKSARKNPNVLLKDDRVHVPELDQKEEPCETEMHHKFVRKGEPSYVRIVLMQGDQPWAEEAYVLEIDGELSEGKTTADGEIMIPIRGNAKRGKITIGPDQEEFPLTLGTVPPIEEMTGVQARLNNLAFDAGAVDGKIGPRTEAALTEFQKKHGLRETGEPDQPTRNKLQEVHGC